ncbi:MAG: EFR1 family ferrodoxin [Lachnospiraceae bacterium]|nr:EFR1 family ferrodoxin [Lachnospiraceae bacterium]
MKKIIYYFSGTGNSLYTAGKIAEAIGGAEIVSVRCSAETVSAEDADIIGFVCPVYEWDIPGAFKEFIGKITINPNAYIFMVTTYIAVLGKSFETVAEILEEKGADLHYGRAIRCVASQCIAYPPFPPERIMIPYMEKQIEKAGREISTKTQRDYPRMSSLMRRRYHKVMGPYMKIEKEYDKGFYTDDRCKGCGVCEKVCPTQNIIMQNNRPTWNHQCHGCNACVAYCPTKAIQFKTPQAYKELDTIICKMLRLPEGRKRYHHPLIKAGDLMVHRKEIVPNDNKAHTG